MAVRRPYEKYLDKGLRGWIMRTAQKHYWCVADFYQLDDLIADGYLAFAITKSRYGHRVENKAHFMSLFKRVYMSMIIDMANARTRREKYGVADIPISQVAVPGHETQMMELLGDVEQSDADLELILSHASVEVRKLITKMKAGKLAHRKPQKRQDGTRETTNDFFNRVLRTRGIDFTGELKSLLMPA